MKELEGVFTEKKLLLPALIAISNKIDGLTTSQLIEILREKLRPTGKDLETINGRKDNYFSQKVRNLISHKTINKYVDFQKDRMIINDQGINYIMDNSLDYYSADIEGNDDFRDENEGYIFDFSSVQVDNMYLSVSDLKRKYDRRLSGISANTLKLDVSFQRAGGIWSSKNKSLFIESVILGIPIPSIYLSEDKEGTLVVIDGRQRLSTLFDFIDDKFKLYGLSIMKELNNKKFSDFIGGLEKYKTRIEDRSLHIAKLRYGTDETFIIETFERVNTKGARLNAQEIRNALHQGKSTQLLNEISDMYIGNNEIIDKKRMKDKYLILRYFAMRIYYNKLRDAKSVTFKSITDYLANVMNEINGLDDVIINNYKKEFCQTYNRVISILDKENAFRIGKGKPINMIVFEMQLLLTSLLFEKDDADIKKAFEKLFVFGTDDIETDFDKNMKYHRDSKENIEERLRWVKSIVEN